MKPIVSISLVVFLTLVFASISVCGIRLIYVSLDSNPTASSEKNGANSPSEVTVETNEDGVRIEITTIIPGVIVFVFGAAGLGLMLIKIPVKRILSVEYPEGSPTGTIGLVTAYTMTPQIRLAEQTERLPLLIWALVRNREIATRAEDT